MNDKIKQKSVKHFYHMYGNHAVLAALNNPMRHIEHIFCTENYFELNQTIIQKHKYEIVYDDFLTKLLRSHNNNPQKQYNKNLHDNIEYNHQGVVAFLHSIFLDKINEIDFTKIDCKIAILDQITDSQNIGAIIRSAAAFDIDAIIMTNDNAPEENAAIAKVACGTLELVKIIKVTNLCHSLEYLKKQGFWIIGFDSEAKETFSRHLIYSKVAVVLGSENKGLRRLTMKTCDILAKIAMTDKVESLNVSNAASIIFHSLYNIKQ